MIMREWRGRALRDHANAYPTHFRGSVLPELQKIPGFVGAHLCQRDLLQGDEVEFLVLTKWESMDAIRSFAGASVDKAVVEPAAAVALIHLDDTVRHYDVLEENGAADSKPMSAHVSKIEELRHSYRPKRITTLFVGESAPIGGSFFYDGNSQLYRYVKKAFGGRENFLTEFMQKGFFLDDLVLYPINNLTGNERKKMHQEWVPSLAKRIAEYRPLAVVSMLGSISYAVESAIKLSGLQGIVHYMVPFAGMGHQGKFQQQLLRSFRNCPSPRAIREPAGMICENFCWREAQL